MNKYLLIVAYCTAVLIANLTAMTFISLPLFGIIAVGTLFFGAVFTLRDCLHSYGRKTVYITIIIAGLVNIGAALITETPIRIIIASFITIIFAETVDTEIYQKLLNLPWIHRVLGSNLVSIPVDTLLFNIIAFIGVLNYTTIISIIFGDLLIKFITATILGFGLSTMKVK